MIQNIEHVICLLEDHRAAENRQAQHCPDGDRAEGQHSLCGARQPRGVIAVDEVGNGVNHHDAWQQRDDRCDDDQLGSLARCGLDAQQRHRDAEERAKSRGQQEGWPKKRSYRLALCSYCGGQQARPNSGRPPPAARRNRPPTAQCRGCHQVE